METRLLSSHDINPEKWDEFIFNSPQGCIYATRWYLDIVCGDWSAIIVSDSDQWLSVFPLNLKKKLLVPYSLQPILTKYLGVFFHKKEFPNYFKESEWKKEVLKACISKIPSGLARFEYNFSPFFDYGLPFYWNEYTLRTQYTYIIDLRLPLDQLFERFSSSVRNNIKKARNKKFVFCKSENPEDVVKIIEAKQKNGKKIMEEKYFPRIKKIFKEANSRGLSDLFVEKDGEQIISCLFLLYYKNICTNFVGMVHPEYRNTGVNSHILWTALPDIQKRSEYFDFAGSMLEGVEAFNRQFDTLPMPYLNISKKRIFS